MSAWEKVKLGDVCSRVFSGGTPSRTHSSYYDNGDIPWLNTGEVNFNEITSTANHITQAGSDNRGGSKMSGHRNFNELLARMSPDRRARVKTEADTLHREYVLSQIRQRLGFTQAEIAERLGVSQPTYAVCERGGNMRIGTLQKIVAALGGELSVHVAIDGCDYYLQMPQSALA